MPALAGREGHSERRRAVPSALAQSSTPNLICSESSQSTALHSPAQAEEGVPGKVTPRWQRSPGGPSLRT